MPNEPDTAVQPDLLVDGGTPTDEEARLSAELEGLPENPTEEPKPAEPAAAEPAAAEPGAPVADEPPPPEPTPTAAPPAAAASPAAAAVVPQPQQEPQPPRDFDAAYAENQKKFDDGDIDAEAFQKTMRDISREEAGFTARLEIFRERQQTQVQRAQSEFNAAAVAWEAENKAFMANPLYAQAMQQAIVAVDKQTPGMAPADLLAAAQKAAFEFTHYTPPTPPAAPDGKAAIARAQAARKPAAVPATLAGAPTAAHVDAPVSASAYANLDGLDIDNLENQLAHMTPAQIEAYLSDAPGANATGQ